MKKLVLLFLMGFSCSRLFGATLYVDLNSTAPAAPFDSWASASTHNQAAVNAATTGDTIMITNGHYLLDAEVSITSAVTLQSVNGPDATIVDGQGSVRCFNLGESVCIISGNFAYQGGGMNDGYRTSGIAKNCVINGNTASHTGGGADACYLYNCTVTGNSADIGGGIYSSVVNNCIVWYNKGSFGNVGG